MNNCSTGCGRESVITWPLLGNYSLCSKDYDNPPNDHARRIVAESQMPHDDFDIDPLNYIPSVEEIIDEFREDRVWTTKEGKDIPFVALSSQHLSNIVRFLTRRIKEVHDAAYLHSGSEHVDYLDSMADLWNEKVDILLEEVDARHMSRKAALEGKVVFT